MLRIANENPSWGYTRIQGALKNLSMEISRSTIANILREHGIDPAPERGARTKWSTLLKSHWKTLVASDFLTVEVWRLRGMTTYCILVFIEQQTRAISIAGVTIHPDERWMLQMARNFLDPESGFGSTSKRLIVDRDTKYCAAFRNTLCDASHSVIRLPPRSPNLSVHGRSRLSNFQFMTTRR